MKSLLYIITLTAWALCASTSAQESPTVKSAPAGEINLPNNKTDAPQNESPKKITEIPTNSSRKLDTKDYKKDRLGRLIKKDVIKVKVDTSAIFWKTCLSLALIIGLILAAFLVLKKVKLRLYHNTSDNPLRINHKITLDNKNYLALVRAYEEEYLISVGPQGTTLIARYSLIDKSDAETEDGNLDFEAMLNKEGKFPVAIKEQISSIDLTSLRDSKK